MLRLPPRPSTLIPERLRNGPAKEPLVVDDEDASRSAFFRTLGQILPSRLHHREFR